MITELKPEEGIAGKFVKTAFDENGVLSKIEFTNDMIMNVINIGMTLYRTAFAIVIHSQRKKPAFAIPSTITIIPTRKIIVAQLIPPVLSDEAPASYQNESVKMFLIFNVSSIASMLCIATPNTRTSVASPHTNVIT